MKLTEERANTCLRQFLVFSCLYYKYGISAVSDECFDEIALDLKDNFDIVTHELKHMVTEDMLNCQSAFSIEEYPEQILFGARALAMNLGKRIGYFKDPCFDGAF